jgi:GNAT superfamily N-acetyltransferase
MTESVLYRLTTEALVAFLGQSEKFECVLSPGVELALCNEPVADLNYVVAGRGASDSDHFRDACQTCISRGQPFLAILFPEAGEGVGKVAEQLGMAYAVDFPMMVRDDTPIEPAGNDAIDVGRATDDSVTEACASVLGNAFSMPEDSVRRVTPPSVVESPGLDIYLAFDGARPVGSVTLTHHGDTTGIWAMGTDSRQQRRGIGRRLLSTAMCEARSLGARRFYLGATPAGYRLYESLGFETRVVTKVWASGETHQA